MVQDPDRIPSRDGPRQSQDSRWPGVASLRASPFHVAACTSGDSTTGDSLVDRERRRPSPSLAWINAIASFGYRVLKQSLDGESYNSYDVSMIYPTKRCRGSD